MRKLTAFLLGFLLLSATLASADVQLLSNGTNVGIVTKLNVVGPTVTRSGQTGTITTGSQTGNVTVTGNLTVTGTEAIAGTLTSASAISGAAPTLTPGATVTLNASLGNVFSITPAQNETISVTNQIAGQQLGIIVTTSGTSTYVLTCGTNMKCPNVLNTGITSGKKYAWSFLCDSGACNEVTRSTAL